MLFRSNDTIRVEYISKSSDISNPTGHINIKVEDLVKVDQSFATCERLNKAHGMYQLQAVTCQQPTVYAHVRNCVYYQRDDPDKIDTRGPEVYLATSKNPVRLGRPIYTQYPILINKKKGYAYIPARHGDLKQCTCPRLFANNNFVAGNACYACKPATMVPTTYEFPDYIKHPDKIGRAHV